MRKLAAVALGVVTAIGGFVDIGELVTLPALSVVGGGVYYGGTADLPQYGKRLSTRMAYDSFQVSRRRISQSASNAVHSCNP